MRVTQLSRWIIQKLNLKHSFVVKIKLILALWVSCFTVGLSACGRNADSTSVTDSASGPDSVSAEQSAANDTLTFAFGGDTMMGTTFPDDSKGEYLPAKPEDLFKDVKAVLEGADFTALNLEGVLLDKGGTPKPGSDPRTWFVFRMPRKYASLLTEAGVDAVSVANNHVNDLGPEGLASSMATLDSLGIAYSGIEGKCESTVVERGGRRIGFAAFGFSKGTTNLNDLNKVRKVVSDLAERSDIVVVSFHHGEEGKSHTRQPHKTESGFGQPRGNGREFARAAIDAGADIVFGHGPHVTRAVDMYKDRIIFYSLGNFVTPYRMTISGISGHAPVMTVKTDADGKFISGRIHPFIQQKGAGPKPDTSGAVINQIRTLTQQDCPDASLQITPTGEILHK